MRQSVRLLWITVAVIAATILWVVNCSGPQPAVTGVQVRPPDAPGAPYVLEASLENRGRGQGQVAVTGRLIDRATGRTYEESARTDLAPRERSIVAIPFNAPPGEYEGEVEALYPPR